MRYLVSRNFGKRSLGTAIDIGTSDIKGALIDIPSKKELARTSVPNEQRSFGPDVITRLHFATINKKGLGELNKRIISAINKLLARLAKEAAVDKSDIKKIVAVGNSAMYHLVLMLKADSLARAPFRPLSKRMRVKNAYKMGIDVAKNATLKLLPNVGGFVGSDTLASILSSGIYKDKKYSILMDIGTNGEIVIGSKKRILVSSCACGPAFESGRIRPGSRAIDLISALLNRGAIDKTGRLAAGETMDLRQQDVREIQVAKAALRAGIEILRSKLALDIKDIHKLYITGRFGVRINIKNAKNIGLIPSGIADERIVFLKDGALSGAKRVLLDLAAEKEIHRISAKCEHIELHRDKDFHDIFAAAMGF